MAKYKCEICDYTTLRSTDLVRHKQSNKHLLNVNTNPSSSLQIIPVSSLKRKTKSNKDSISNMKCQESIILQKVNIRVAIAEAHFRFAKAYINT